MERGDRVVVQIQIKDEIENNRDGDLRFRPGQLMDFLDYLP